MNKHSITELYDEIGKIVREAIEEQMSWEDYFSANYETPTKEIVELIINKLEKENSR